MFRSSATDIKNLFLKGEISALEITDYYLTRVRNLNPQIQAFLSTFPERAREKAKALDKKRAEKKSLGKLAGIPVALKDNMHIAGELSTCASKFLSNYRAIFDATVTRLLEEEDAILIGKTNMDEFAMGSSTENSAYFPTKNPWDLQCVPGGSSGGSAAAVSARLCPLALGSDTGGSIRQPAALTGIVGFKPTYGRVSRYGLVAFGSSLDQIGPLAPSVADAGLAMEVLGKYCPRDSTSLNLPQEAYTYHWPKDLKAMKIGIPWHFLETLSPKAHQLFSSSVNILKNLGAEIVDINLDILKYCIEVYYIIATAEASTNLARFDGIRYGVRSKAAQNLEEVYALSRDDGFGIEVKRRILLGTYVLSAGYQNAYYKKAQKVRTLMLQAFEEVFTKCDLIALPTAPTAAFPIHSILDPLQMYLQDLFTIPANLAGLPAISLPCGFIEKEKPFGLQLVGPQLHDVSVIQSAYAFEQAAVMQPVIPPLFAKEAL